MPISYPYMMGRTAKLAAKITVVFSLAAAFLSCETPAPAPDSDNKAPITERRPSSEEVRHVSPLDAFNIVHKIATSPRCTNCHAKGERPIQLEGTESRFHNMDIHREFTKLGGQCTTCHQNRNFAQAHLPPGAENWRMPSSVKSYSSDASPAELCRIWRGPSNAFEEGSALGQQRTPDQLLEHVKTDPLVNWAFNPGPGRTPAFPPVKDQNGNTVSGHEYFVDYFEIWVKGGAPCPSN